MIAAMNGENFENRDRGRVAPSRTAAIGGTRVARMAGKMPARTVMRVPAIRLTMTVRVPKTVPACGRSSPKDARTEFSPLARPRPRKSPMTEAMRPITNASRITEPRICRRDAPIVRSVANSRTRWATVIDSVLKMTKAPTKSAMPPNARRKYRMNFVNPSMSLV